MGLKKKSLYSYLPNMCRISLLTTSLAIILVQATSTFCLVSLLLPCPFFSPVIC